MGLVNSPTAIEQDKEIKRNDQCPTRSRYRSFAASPIMPPLRCAGNRVPGEGIDTFRPDAPSLHNSSLNVLRKICGTVRGPASGCSADKTCTRCPPDKSRKRSVIRDNPDGIAHDDISGLCMRTGRSSLARPDDSMGSPTTTSMVPRPKTRLFFGSTFRIPLTLPAESQMLLQGQRTRPFLNSRITPVRRPEPSAKT